MALLDHLSMESVDFQSTTFYKELTIAFAELKAAGKNAAESEVITQLSQIIANHTGMNIQVVIDQYDPCVEVPHIDKNHPLVHNYLRNYVNSNDGLALVNKAGEAVRGTVSLKTGKVTGIFTELKAKIHLPTYMFETNKFTDEEIAAVTLHEVGHIFTYFEYITRSVTTNQVLAGVSKAMDGSTIEQREAVLISAKQALKLKDLDTKELAKSTNAKAVEVVILSNLAEDVVSELGSNIYDMSTWEMLADQYAARYNAYRPLVTALAKIYKGVWHISFRSTPAFLAMEALKLCTIILNPFLFLMLCAIDGRGDGTYDQPGARLKRVRNQIVENLKDKELSKDDHDRLMADLTLIDEVLNGVNDRRQLAGVLWDSLAPSARKARRQELLQKQLEELVANDLFIKAAELRQLS